MESQIAAYPAEVLSFLKHGFKVATRISSEDRKLLVAALVKDFRGGKRRLLSEAVNISDLSESEVTQISTVYSVVMGLLNESDASVDDFAVAGRGKIFDLEDEASARAIARDLCDVRGELETSLQTRKISGAVLPSFVELETVLDVRLKFDKGILEAYAPVIVAYLNTDARQHRMWFQMTKGDVESLIRQLSDTLLEIEAAETLMAAK